MNVDKLYPAEIAWIDETVASMRRNGEWGAAGVHEFGRVWIHRIGETIGTGDDAHVIQFWPINERIEIFGIRAFGPVELVHVQTLPEGEHPDTTRLVGRPLEHYAEAPFTEIDLAGPIHAKRGLALTFRATHEAREIDVFLVGTPAK